MASEQSNRDAGHFGEIAEAHRAMLHRVAVRLSGNEDTAKDLVQETLLRALHRFGQFQQGTQVGAWLVAILTNLYFDHVRHQQVVRKAEPELAASDAIEVDEGSPIAEVDDAELYAAVQALEPELREAVQLCYLQQLRYREAAAILNVPVSTIGTRLMRARARLRVLLTTTSPDAMKS